MNQAHRERGEGFTLLEMTVALTMLSVGVLALAGTLGSTMELGDDRLTEIQKSVHMQNALVIVESIDFDQIAATFGAGSGNEQFWCDATGQIWFSDPGDSIAVGSIQVFDEEDAVPISFADTTVGLDLNANGVIDSGTVTDYQILPLRIILAYPNNPGTTNEVGEFFIRP